MYKEIKDSMIIGFALFAMFFGAGNLIFPPQIGVNAGDKWLIALFGFTITAVILPILGVIAASLLRKKNYDMLMQVHPLFSQIFTTITILAIGPFLAIPRTGATVFEIAIVYNFPNLNMWIANLIFYGLALFFALKETKFIAIIGKFFTPILLITVLILIVRGIFSPQDMLVNSQSFSRIFVHSFVSGYQTLDALGSSLVVAIVMQAIFRHGHEKKHMRIMIQVALIAGLLLFVIYGGLLYLAAKVSVFNINQSLSNVELLLYITQHFLGNSGLIILGIIVYVACLTTATGLLGMVGNYFYYFFNKTVSYQIIVIISAIISYFFSLVGVDSILHYSIPFLLFIYPIIITLIFCTLLSTYIPTQAMRAGVIVVVIVSILTSIENLFGVSVPFMHTILPFGTTEFIWVVPTSIVIILYSLCITYLVRK